MVVKHETFNYRWAEETAIFGDVVRKKEMEELLFDSFRAHVNIVSLLTYLLTSRQQMEK